MAISVLTPLAMDEYGDALRALLTSPRAAVPDGWKLVPIEPTDQMMVKGGFSFCGRVPNDEVFPEVRKVWERLLDAAPDAPVAEAEPAPDPLRRRVERLLVELHAEGRLSEGQCAKMLDISSVEWRELVEFLAPGAQAVAEYDGNHVQNHCPECNEHEAECTCTAAVAADGADTDELQGIVEACEELGCPDGMTPRQFISDIWSLLIAWYQASSEGKIAVSDPAYHLVTATAALMGDERAAVSPATSESKCTRCGSSTAQACNERGCFYLESGEGEPATADKRAAQKYDPCDPGNWRDGNDAVGDYQAARTSQTAAPQANAADESEDAYVIRRLSETLADVCVTLRGDDPVHPDDPLNKIELVKRLAEVLRMEVELYRAQASAPAEARKPVATFDDGLKVYLDSWTGGRHEAGSFGEVTLRFTDERQTTVREYRAKDIVPADAGEAVASVDEATFKHLFYKHGGPVDSEGWCINESGLRDFLSDLAAVQGAQGGKGGEA
ncbi:hypothetical protein EFP17_28485 [Burkholderia glumae]|nr:hypothetical protein EFP17_28485 [Burkholderia glumae]